MKYEVRGMKWGGALGALACLAVSAFGQGVKITALPAATNVNDADLTVIVQSNVTKRATAALIRAGITGGTSDWNALSNVPSWISGATWQTNTNTAAAREALGAYGTNSTMLANSLGITHMAGDYGLVAHTDDGDVVSVTTINTNFLPDLRASLRLGWAGLTNTNAAGFRADLGLGSWTTNASLTASLISDFSNAVVAVAPASTNASALTAGTLPDARLSTNVVTRNTNGVAQAAAWTLNPAPTNGVATIQTNQFGVGWDDLGRFTIQTPVMPISIYSTGDPSTPTIYVPGTIVANRFSAVYFDSVVYASNIVGGPSGGNIADSVMRESMPEVLRNFMGGDGAAGAAGVPYILTNASMQPVPGDYVPYGTVITNGAGNLELTGQWAEINAFRTNLFEGGGVPAGGAPEGSVLTAVAGQYVGVSPLPVFFTRQQTNSPTVTNTADITNGVTLAISNVPAGTYLVHILTGVGGTANKVFGLAVEHAVGSPRQVYGSGSPGSMWVAYSAITNMTFVEDGGAGERIIAGQGFLVTTNTGAWRATGRGSVGGTNTYYIMSNSFLRLQKIN